jgi:hypothetical protein
VFSDDKVVGNKAVLETEVVLSTPVVEGSGGIMKTFRLLLGDDFDEFHQVEHDLHN